MYIARQEGGADDGERSPVCALLSIAVSIALTSVLTMTESPVNVNIRLTSSNMVSVL